MNKLLTIQEIKKLYEQNQISSKELRQEYLNRINAYDQSINAFVTIVESDDSDEHQLIPIAHKDIYSTKGIETTAASSILKDYIPPYDATSVTRLAQKGFSTIGKVNCDAFAHGATGENSDLMITKNPYQLTRTPGGSSSGSAAAVAAGFAPVATATDTGGSIRLPASFTNTVGLKPTYGRVSRYGVIAMTSSTDSIGHITSTVWDNAYVLNITAGHDPNDATSSQHPVDDYLKLIDKDITGIKIGVPQEYVQGLDPIIKERFNSALKVLESLGAIIDTTISLPHTEYAIYTYYIITPAEVSSNLARLDGIRYGHDRSQFGAEAKRRIMIGTYCLSSGYYDAYYLKAQKVRTLIIEDFKNAFEKVDVLVAPVSPSFPPELGSVIKDPVTTYMMDVLTVPINLAGVPALAVPAGFSQNPVNGKLPADSLPCGIQFIGNYFDEKQLYQVGHAFEQSTNYYLYRPTLTETT
ncbi:Asp-tRNA(Asn)/Glu-tRNA(Gln) amidotransferase subunit GatA [candidate division WWE3 bacterium]|nr:Asp-tRNA(Asn)/Glu-tRNA(Gln) amidotransferase subunit GatA [candidate division WWE3 bacterium]